MPESIKTYEVLPEHLWVKGADIHLYRIGLSLYKPWSGGVRNILHDPIIVFVFAAHLFIQQTIIILLPEREDRFHLYFGDMGHLIGARIQLAQACALVGLLSLMSQLFNRYNYRNGIEPTDLGVFQMMVGMKSPKSLGLNDNKIVWKLLKTSKRVLTLTTIICPKVKYCIFLIMVSVIATKVSKDDLLIAVPYAIIWPLLAQYSFNIIIFQFVYYYLITYYLHLKLKQFNDKLRVSSNKVKLAKGVYISPVPILQESHRIYAEIDEYNYKYWSKFLGALWVIISSEIASMAYLTFFGDTIWVLKVLFGCVTAIFAIILIFVIWISSAVFNEANHSHNILLLLFHTIQFRGLGMKIKFRTLIERVGEQKIGFFCWKFFIINNFRGYEILILTAVVFIRILEMFPK